jgi:hypothetical protein
MYSLSRAIALHKRIERELRAAGLCVCPENVRWWSRLPASEQRAWLGMPDQFEDDYGSA